MLNVISNKLRQPMEVKTELAKFVFLHFFNLETTTAVYSFKLSIPFVGASSCHDLINMHEHP